MIGPIVVPNLASVAASGAGGGRNEPTGPGGSGNSGAVEARASDGGEDTGESGIIVIGPIVIGGSASGTATSIPVISDPTTQTGTVGTVEAPKS